MEQTATLSDPILPRPSIRGTASVAWSVVIGNLLLVSRLIAISSIGLVLNWGFLILVWLTSAATPKAATPGGITIIVLLGAAFPLLYVFIGQKQGVQVLARHCYRRHQETLFQCVILLLRKCLEQSAISQASASLDHLRHALHRIEDLPWIMRMTLKYFLRQKDFQTLMLELLADPKLRNGDINEIASRYAPAFHRAVLEGILSLNMKWFWIVFAANVPVIAMALWSIRRSIA